MLRWLLVPMLASVVTARSGAQDKPPAPSGPPPQIVVARGGEKDRGVLVTFSMPQFRSIQRAVTVEKDGKKVELTVTAYECDFRDVEVMADGKEVKAFGVDGKAIEPKELAKRLGKPTQVAVVFHHPEIEPKLDPYYLRVLREDVVVFTGPGTRFFPAPQKK